MKEEETQYKLTSVDYARLIQFAALKFHKVLLNKTQINKILFYVYGVYLTLNKGPLFTGDDPKAWPYGPVFPIVNKRVNINERVTRFTHEQVVAFKNNPAALQIVKEAVAVMHQATAMRLTQWSHKPGSPWYDSIYTKDGKQNGWNAEIPDELIKNYFSKPENKLN